MYPELKTSLTPDEREQEILRRWKEKDQGIWEIRGEPRDFLYSKLMCWVALDRAIVLATQLNAQDRVQGWIATRDEIRAAILEHGWSDRAGASLRPSAATTWTRPT